MDGFAGLGDGHFGAGVGAVGRHGRGRRRQGREHAGDRRSGGPRGGLVSVDRHIVFGGGAHDDGVAARDALVGGGGDEVVSADGDAGRAQGVARGREEAGHIVGDAVNLDGHVTIGSSDGSGSGAGHQKGRRCCNGNDGCTGGLNAHVSPEFVGSVSRASSTLATRRADSSDE